VELKSIVELDKPMPCRPIMMRLLNLFRDNLNDLWTGNISSSKHANLTAFDFKFRESIIELMSRPILDLNELFICFQSSPSVQASLEKYRRLMKVIIQFNSQGIRFQENGKSVWTICKANHRNVLFSGSFDELTGFLMDQLKRKREGSDDLEISTIKLQKRDNSLAGRGL
jgi:hypothetical protein